MSPTPSTKESQETDTIPAAEGEPPSAADSQCRRVRGALPWTAYIISAVAIFNQWCYFAFAGPLREFSFLLAIPSAAILISFAENYVQNASNDPLRPGALGLGESTATITLNAFRIVSYATPLASGILADTYLGRSRTVLFSL